MNKIKLPFGVTITHYLANLWQKEIQEFRDLRTFYYNDLVRELNNFQIIESIRKRDDIVVRGEESYTFEYVMKQTSVFHDVRILFNYLNFNHYDQYEYITGTIDNPIPFSRIVLMSSKRVYDLSSLTNGIVTNQYYTTSNYHNSIFWNRDYFTFENFDPGDTSFHADYPVKNETTFYRILISYLMMPAESINYFWSDTDRENVKIINVELSRLGRYMYYGSPMKIYVDINL